MGNVGGVVHWLSSSSSQGLLKWEELASSGLSSTNKIIDAARLISAWPHLRSSFLSFVQSGRWLQSFYVSERKQLIAFPVYLQPLALSVATEDDNNVVLFHLSNNSPGGNIHNQVNPSCLLPFDSALRHDSHSYALLLAVVFPLYLDHLQHNGPSQFWSQSSSMPGSPSQTLTQPLPSAMQQQSKFLESFGGNNPQENSLRQYFLEKFFIGGEILEPLNDCNNQTSIYSNGIQDSFSSPTLSDKSDEDDDNFVTPQSDLWHLDETFVSAMAQLDFMTLEQRLKQDIHYKNDPLHWIKDILFQLESVPLGVAVLNASAGSTASHSIFLDDLRISYCNSLFAKQISVFLPYLLPDSANPSITRMSLAGSSKDNTSVKNASSFSARLSAGWSGRSLFPEDSSGRHSVVTMNNDSANGSLSLTRFSQRLSHRLTWTGRVRQSQLMTGDEQKHAVRIYALHKMFSQLPLTYPAFDTSKNESKVINCDTNTDIVSLPAQSSLASRASSHRSMATSSISESELVSGGTISQQIIAMHANKDKERWVVAVKELHEALRYRKTATILTPSVVDHDGYHSSVLWIIRPVFNKRSSKSDVSQLMVLQISVPVQSNVELIPEQAPYLKKCGETKNPHEHGERMSLKHSEMTNLVSRDEEDDGENDENIDSSNIQNRFRLPLTQSLQIPHKSKKYSSKSCPDDVDQPAVPIATISNNLKRIICSSDEQLLQKVKIAEDICNILPPLLSF